MNCIIERILIFNGSGDKREVAFGPGLNVVSGDSKTGKSALLEITDYCLFSSRSGIPKGEITNFATLFVLVLAYKDRYLLLGRFGAISKDPEKCIFKIVFSRDEIDKLTYEELNSWKKEYVKDGQELFEQAIGFSFNGIANPALLPPGGSNYKAGIRGIASFVFQHQNLIANKHALFYRFDNQKKREKTLEEWPILMGWFDQEYFETRAALDETERRLKAETRIHQLQIDGEKGNVEDLRSRVATYYQIFNQHFDASISSKDLKRLSENLPSFALSGLDNTGDQEELLRVKEERDSLLRARREVDHQLGIIKKNSELANKHANDLRAIYRQAYSDPSDAHLNCPLCHMELPEVTENVLAAQRAGAALQTELNKLDILVKDPFKERQELKDQRESIESQLWQVQSKIETIEQFQQSLSTNMDQIRAAERLRGSIETTAKHLLSIGSTDKTDELKELEYRVKALKGKLSGYDSHAKYRWASTFLEEKMGLIREDLDFEEDLNDYKMVFDSEVFDFHLNNGKSNIYISEMGSGANWLACHLSLFLAFLWLHCKSNARVPSFLILDQPSQVYFPRGTTKENDTTSDDSNVIAVKNIYKTILKVIEWIKKDCEFAPQVIVTDHIGALDISPWDFDSYVQYRWTEQTGKKLI